MLHIYEQQLLMYSAYIKILRNKSTHSDKPTYSASNKNIAPEINK